MSYYKIDGVKIISYIANLTDLKWFCILINTTNESLNVKFNMSSEVGKYEFFNLNGTMDEKCKENYYNLHNLDNRYIDIFDISLIKSDHKTNKKYSAIIGGFIFKRLFIVYDLDILIQCIKNK